MGTTLRLIALALLVGCGGGTPNPDTDGGHTGMDSGHSGMDSGPAVDTGTTMPDTGTRTDSGGGDNCASGSVCLTCTMMGTCGWCPASNTCLTGTSTGPSTGTCASGWDWVGTNCPASDCSALHDCTTCADAGCGWCSATSTCSAGNSCGPTGGACASGYVSDSADCAAPPSCSAATDCSACQALTGCDWCNSSNHCVAVDITSGGACTPAECAMADLGAGRCPCNMLHDCSSCASNGCGWCGATSACVAGDSCGPTTGTCASGYVVATFDCTAPPAACGTATNCSSCLGITGCDWCTTSNTCVAVSTTTGAACTTGDCAMPNLAGGTCPCNTLTNCAGCADTGCGWCSASSTCMTGSSCGPMTGACGAGFVVNSADCSMPPNCAAASTCGACTLLTGCDWCNTSSTCVRIDWDTGDACVPGMCAPASLAGGTCA